MKEWKLKIDQEEEILEFKDKKVRLRTNREENLIAYLEMVEKWENKDEIDLVEKEDEVNSEDKIYREIKEIVGENLEIAKFIKDMSE